MAFEYNLEKQHAKGKLHAIERINLICDKNSFMEIYAGARHQCTNFGMDKKDLPYDGVITGFGTINGRKVGILQFRAARLEKFTEKKSQSLLKKQ